jgi:hypothetical protein
MHYLSVVTGDCPEERFDELTEHECKSNNCVDCWKIRLSEVIKIKDKLENNSKETIDNE